MLLKHQINRNPACARYIAGKRLVFQIRTQSGVGRYFVISDRDINSYTGLTTDAKFTLSFKDAN